MHMGSPVFPEDLGRPTTGFAGPSCLACRHLAPSLALGLHRLDRRLMPCGGSSGACSATGLSRQIPRRRRTMPFALKGMNDSS